MALRRRFRGRDRADSCVCCRHVRLAESRCLGQRNLYRSSRLTTSFVPPRWLRLPHGYQFLDLREIACAEKDRLVINKNKLLGWIKGLRKGLDKPARLRAGRPSKVDLVNHIFRERRARNLPVISQRTEARELRADVASRCPDNDPPAVKTIEHHLRNLSK
jgi:hypothetical protein